jgi:hypothetical protein
MSEILNGESGEMDYKLSFEGTDLILSGAYDGKGLGAELKIKLQGEYFMDKLAEAIPGNIDNAVINMLKGALKK